MIKKPLYCPRFINREKELLALLDLTRRAIAGNGALAIVSGEAGIGKTRFLGEFRKRLPRGIADFDAACLEFAPAPLSPIQAILSAIEADSREPFGVEALFEGTGDDADSGKLALFRRIGGAVRQASVERPIVVFVDDLHWADTATLDFLQFLAGEVDSLRVLLVLAYRTEALSKTHPLTGVIARLARLTYTHWLDLEPLAEPAIQELIDATLFNHPAVALEVQRDVRTRSEGNPLFAEELLKAVVDRGSATPVAPASVRSLILERMKGLGQVELQLLESAALIGRRFQAAFLERVSGRSKRAVMAFLRLAVDEHLLIEDRLDAGWFVFRHALVQEAILSNILVMELRAIHFRIAQEIEREAGSANRALELSDHYWQAAAFTECAPYATAAADGALARHAYAEAVEQYERVIACGGTADLERAILHENAARAQSSVGNARKSVEHLRVASALFQEVDALERAAAACLELALMLRRCGDTAGAFEALARAEELERARPDNRLRGRLLIQLAHLHVLVGDWPRTAAHLEEAEPFLHLVGPRDLVRFYRSRASLHFARSERAGWQLASERASLIARESGDPSLVAFSESAYGLEALKIGRLDLGLGTLEAVVTGGVRFEPLYNITYARLGYVQALLLAARLPEARAQLYEILAENSESLTIQSTIALLGVSLSTVLKDNVLLERCYSRAVLEKIFATKDPRLIAQLAAPVAEMHLAEGNQREAVDLLQRMLESLPDDELLAEMLLPVAVCCEKRDVEASAQRLLRSDQQSNPYAHGCVRLFRAYSTARFGSKKAADREAAAAARQFHDLGMPLLEAEAYLLAHQQTRATVILERIGARRTPRHLATGAHGVTRVVQLTPREREVVDFATHGLSNDAIASELSVSERTVESHLAAAYKKLGVRSRAELRAIARV